MDKKWQLDYYEEFKTVGLGDIASEKIVQNSEHEKNPKNEKDLTLKEMQKNKLVLRQSLNVSPAKLMTK